MLIWLAVLAASFSPQSPAVKGDEAAYALTIEKRASDVLDELRLGDQAAAGRVREAIIGQYRGLRAVQDARDAKIREIRAGGNGGGAARVEAEWAGAEASASALNDRFLAGLARDLSPEQVETVKDKMTYHKLQVTYNGYLEMLPKLTAEQKRAVSSMLREARDRAVYAGSAEEKTAIFDRYKGRVNNYLSKEGYDLKKASKEWAERRKGAR